MVTRKWRFACLQAAAELTLIDGKRRKEGVVVGVMKTVSRGRTGWGAVDQKFENYLSESSNFVVKRIQSQFSFEIFENEMRDSQLCKVYSSGGTFRCGTSSWKYRRSKSAPAGILHAVVQDANRVSAENETKLTPLQFSSQPKAKWIF